MTVLHFRAIFNLHSSVGVTVLKLH